MAIRTAQLEDLATGDEPLIRVVRDTAGRPCGAVGAMHIAAPLERVWQIVNDVDRYADYVPMVHRSRRTGDQVEMQLRFRVAVISAKFGFTARVVSAGEHRIELRYLAGEPRDIQLQFAVDPADEGRATVARAAVSFDITSLGWLVKVFLRNHPEIQNGVFPGTALTILDSLRGVAEAG